MSGITPEQMLASHLIDDVEEAIRIANPKVEELVPETDEDGDLQNTLLHGEAYYNLEDAIAEKLREHYQSKVYVLVELSGGLVDTVSVYPSKEKAEQALDEWLKEHGFSSWEEYHDSDTEEAISISEATVQP